MIASAGMAGSWACNCGRRVPIAVEVCRCGAHRPADAGPGAPAPEVGSRYVPPIAGKESRSLPKWTRQVGGLLLAVGVYFGSRGCYRWQASRDARNTSVEALSPLVGAEDARTLVDRHHAACFDETYRTGWGRRQSSKFDAEAYVKCIVRAFEKEGRNAPREVRAHAPAAAPRQMPTPPPLPTRTPTPEPDYGPITLGNFQVTLFKRQPNVRIVFQFAAIGRREALERAKSCVVDVQCGGHPIPGFDDPIVTDCELKVNGSSAVSGKAMSWGNSTPVQGDCTLRFAVVRASRLQSNEIVVDLKETPGR
jgi:hypothetical protein